MPRQRAYRVRSTSISRIHSRLGAPDRVGIIRPTPLFQSLAKAAAEILPSLIVIEAAADVFAGNENDRSQVRQFIGLLRRLAIESGAAVMLIAHPSLFGMASGTGTSGSTAWNNSVRSRLYFTSVKPQEGNERDADVRELRVMKSNYGPAGEIMRLRWQRGLFVPEGSTSTLARVAAEAAVDQVYLDCLDAVAAQGRQVGPYRSNIFAPTIFQQMPQAAGYKVKALLAAQERLFAAGRIAIETAGRGQNLLHRDQWTAWPAAAPGRKSHLGLPTCVARRAPPLSRAVRQGRGQSLAGRNQDLPLRPGCHGAERHQIVARPH
jgi:RecA-family ATPase